MAQIRGPENIIYSSGKDAIIIKGFNLEVVGKMDPSKFYRVELYCYWMALLLGCRGNTYVVGVNVVLNNNQIVVNDTSLYCNKGCGTVQTKMTIKLLCNDEVVWNKTVPLVSRSAINNRNMHSGQKDSNTRNVANMLRTEITLLKEEEQIQLEANTAEYCERVLRMQHEDVVSMLNGIVCRPEPVGVGIGHVDRCTMCNRIAGIVVDDVFYCYLCYYKDRIENILNKRTEIKARIDKCCGYKRKLDNLLM